MSTTGDRLANRTRARQEADAPPDLVRVEAQVLDLPLNARGVQDLAPGLVSYPVRVRDPRQERGAEAQVGATPDDTTARRSPPALILGTCYRHLRSVLRPASDLRGGCPAVTVQQRPQARACTWYSVTLGGGGGVMSNSWSFCTPVTGASARPAPHCPQAAGAPTTVSSGLAKRTATAAQKNGPPTSRRAPPAPCGRPKTCPCTCTSSPT